MHSGPVRSLRSPPAASARAHAPNRAVLRPLRLVATAARGGGDQAWYRNLLESPPVVLQVRTEVFAAVGRPASERPRIWVLMVAVFPKYAAREREAGAGSRSWSPSRG